MRARQPLTADSEEVRPLAMAETATPGPLPTKRSAATEGGKTNYLRGESCGRQLLHTHRGARRHNRMSAGMARKVLLLPFGAPKRARSTAAHKEIVMRHAVVWIDGKEARVFEVDGQVIRPSTVNAPGPHVHRK